MCQHCGWRYANEKLRISICRLHEEKLCEDEEFIEAAIAHAVRPPGEWEFFRVDPLGSLYPILVRHADHREVVQNLGQDPSVPPEACLCSWRAVLELRLDGMFLSRCLKDSIWQ